MLSPDLHPADAASLHPQHCLLYGRDDLQAEPATGTSGTGDGSQRRAPCPPAPQLWLRCTAKQPEVVQCLGRRGLQHQNEPRREPCAAATVSCRIPRAAFSLAGGACSERQCGADVSSHQATCKPSCMHMLQSAKDTGLFWQRSLRLGMVSCKWIPLGSTSSSRYGHACGSGHSGPGMHFRQGALHLNGCWLASNPALKWNEDWAIWAEQTAKAGQGARCTALPKLQPAKQHCEKAAERSSCMARPLRLQPQSSGHDGRHELCPAADTPAPSTPAGPQQELASAEQTGVALPGSTPFGQYWAARDSVSVAVMHSNILSGHMQLLLELAPSPT